MFRLDPFLEAILQEQDAARRKSMASGAVRDGSLSANPATADRVFTLRLSDEQFAALQTVAKRKHLPPSTMARAWLMERVEQELL